MSKEWDCETHGCQVADGYCKFCEVSADGTHNKPTKTTGKEQELPPLDVTAEDRSHWGPELPNESLVGSYRCRERQLRESLAQITTLTAQAEERYASYLENIAALTRCHDAFREEGMSARNRAAAEIKQLKAELAVLTDKLEDARKVADKAESTLTEQAKEHQRIEDDIKFELAALREGATVTFRVNTQKGYTFSFSDEASAREKHSKVPEWLRPASLVEIITHERILDADGGEG